MSFPYYCIMSIRETRKPNNKKWKKSFVYLWMVQIIDNYEDVSFLLDNPLDRLLQMIHR